MNDQYFKIFYHQSFMAKHHIDKKILISKKFLSLSFGDNHFKYIVCHSYQRTKRLNYIKTFFHQIS